MKNKLIDLNNHLFAQLERLCDEDLAGDKLTEEITRSKAVSQIASNVINNAKLALDVAKAINERAIVDVPLMLEQQENHKAEKFRAVVKGIASRE